MAARRCLRRRLWESYVDVPWEMSFATASLISGPAVVLANLRPSSVSQALPYWIGVSWGVALLFGGLFCVLGLVRNDWPTERAGVIFLAASTFLYTIAILVTQHAHGLVPSLGFVAFGTGAIGRIPQHRRQVRQAAWLREWANRED